MAKNRIPTRDFQNRVNKKISKNQRKTHMNQLVLILIVSVISILPTLADTNALIEVKLFKDWMIQGETTFGNLAIKNTGTDPIRLANDAVDFSATQLVPRLLKYASTNEIDPHRERWYQDITDVGDGFFELLPGETHVYEGRKFFIGGPFTGEEFVASIYLGKSFWLNSEPMTVKGVVPDSIELVTTLTDVNGARDVVVVTYKGERWLYIKHHPIPGMKSSGGYYPQFPVSLTNKIRVEPHEGTRLYKIWDGDKSMIYQKGTGIIHEGPDENNVFGKWTRERKQKAEADNAEVRRKKGLAKEGGKP